MFWENNYEQIFKDYKYTVKCNNKHPELDRNLAKPLILLDGFYNETLDKYRFVSAYVKNDTLLYVLKYNILKILLERGIIGEDELKGRNLLPILDFPVNVVDYPNLIYHRHNGSIINSYRMEWSPGYYSFSFNEIILFNILRTVYGNPYDIVNICIEEYEKLNRSLKF